MSKSRTWFTHVILLGVVGLFVGCGGSDPAANLPPLKPPMTEQEGKDLTREITANKGAMGPAKAAPSK